MSGGYSSRPRLAQLTQTWPCSLSPAPFHSPSRHSALVQPETTSTMWQDNSATYGASSSQYYPQQHVAPQPGVPLQFYAPSPVGSTFYSGSRSSLDGHVGAQGSIQQGGGAYSGNIQPAEGWWTAFGTGGFEGEPPLLEGAYRIIISESSGGLIGIVIELGINFSHIRAKSLAVLNPLRQVDEHIMDDADLAGPLLFVFCFGTFLLFVRRLSTLILHLITLTYDVC